MDNLNGNQVNRIDKTVHELEKLLEKIANNYIIKETSGRCNLNSIKMKKTTKKQQPWFNLNCRKLKRQLNHISKEVNKNPDNPYLRSNFYKIRKEYRKLIKSSKRKYEEDVISNLEDSSKDRNLFWRI